MKKYLMMGIAALALASCSKDDITYINPDVQKYETAFIDRFGQPSPNHTWGFGPETRALTRAQINVNGNLWESCPEVGSTEEDDVVAYVTGLNPKPNTNPIQLQNYYVTQIHCGTEAYSNADGGVGIVGSAHMDHLVIAMQNDATVTNGALSGDWEHINNFNAGNCTDWAAGVDGHGNTLVIEGGTFDFAYNGSEDSKYHNRWIAIDGANVPKTGGGNYAGHYYVCFDFEATVDGYTNISNIKYLDPVTGQWANSGNIAIPGTWTEAELAASNQVFAIPVWGWTQEAGNYIERYVYVHLNNPEEVEFFNYSNAVGGNQAINPNSSYLDWIVRLVKAEPKDGDDPDPDPDPTAYDFRVMAEDLTITASGAKSDFDFNDVVFDVKYVSSSKALVKVRAAGGIYPIRIAGRDDKEIHALLGGGMTMTNTYPNNHYQYDAEAFEVDGNFGSSSADAQFKLGVKAITVEVNKGGGWTPLDAPTGKVASKIGVPVNVEWCDEFQDIDTKWGANAFESWVSNEQAPFWKGI